MTINQILEHLASDNSRIFKENYLSQHKDNETLKQVVFLALDPFTQFYIRKIPKYMTDSVPTRTLEKAMEDLSDLSSRRVTGNAGIDWLTDILETLSAEDALVIERIIGKDLKCGASVSTVNKIWPKLIHEFPIMLASGFDFKLVEKIEFPAISQCLSENTVINTNYGNKTIREICESAEDFLVQSYNHTNECLEFKKIIAKSIKLAQADTKWYILTVNGKETQPLTGNHLVWCVNRNTYSRVDELDTSDCILLLK